MPRPTVRKHLTEGQRQSILDSYRRSRLSQREFAAEAGIGVSTLQLWLRKAVVRQSSQPTAFVQVPNLLAQAPGPAVYRLHLPGAIDLEVGSGFRSEELASLLQVLRSL
jgi:hypothetical protein